MKIVWILLLGFTVIDMGLMIVNQSYMPSRLFVWCALYWQVRTMYEFIKEA